MPKCCPLFTTTDYNKLSTSKRFPTLKPHVCKLTGDDRDFCAILTEVYTVLRKDAIRDIRKNRMNRKCDDNDDDKTPCIGFNYDDDLSYHVENIAMRMQAYIIIDTEYSEAATGWYMIYCEKDYMFRPSACPRCSSS